MTTLRLKKYLFRGGVLLGASALLSKLLGLWRDRLVVSTFSPEHADLVYAAFRIPDFFYYLLVGATISVIFLPKIVELSESEQIEYFSSFLLGVLVFFGLLSGVGIIFADNLVQLFASGFAAPLQGEIAQLARILFSSVFLLSLSSVFSANLQSKEHFASIAAAPLIYMGSIALTLFVVGDEWGISVVGFGAVIGAVFHLLVTGGSYLFRGGRVVLCWQKPKKAWKDFSGDFGRRVFNNAAFQINQSVDVWIGSFLLIGSVTAFTLGTNLGHFLLSIVGMSVANSAFPKLSRAKHNYSQQKKILISSIKWIWFICIPASCICALFSREILMLLFGLEGARLDMTEVVFFWTVISLPFACVLPACSRVFLANDDTATPLYATITSLFVATSLAAYLSLIYLPKEEAILGLALGNFTANSLGFLLFAILLWYKYERKC